MLSVIACFAVITASSFAFYTRPIAIMPLLNLAALLSCHFFMRTLINCNVGWAPLRLSEMLQRHNTFFCCTARPINISATDTANLNQLVSQFIIFYLRRLCFSWRCHAPKTSWCKNLSITNYTQHIHKALPLNQCIALIKWICRTVVHIENPDWNWSIHKLPYRRWSLIWICDKLLIAKIWKLIYVYIKNLVWSLNFMQVITNSNSTISKIDALIFRKSKSVCQFVGPNYSW
jgi:hypothetical protein